MPKLSEIVNQPDTPPSQAPSGGGSLGEIYSDYIGGPANDFVRNLLNQGMPGNPLNEFAAGAIAPESLTQAGLTVGTMLAPEAKAAQFFGSEARNAERFMPMVKRLLSPILGGAAGGLAEKGDPIDAAEGAALGAVTAIPAEILGGVSRWFAKSKLAQRFYKEDPKTLGRVVQTLVPEFGNVETPADFGSAVWAGVAQERLSDMYDRRMTAIAESAGRHVPPPFRPDTPGTLRRAADTSAPRIDRNGLVVSQRIQELRGQGVIGGKGSTVDSLMQDIRDLRLKGRTTSGDPKVTLQGRQARDYAAELSDELAGALNGADPKLGRMYKNTDAKYARGAEMLRYLRQPGMIDENGRLDMKLLQTQLKEEHRLGLTHDFTPEEMQQLTDAVFRGGPATVEDVMRKTHAGVRMHASPTGKPGIIANVLDLLKNNDYAGDFEVGGIIEPKMSTLALQRLGAGGAAILDRPISLRKPSSDED